MKTIFSLLTVLIIGCSSNGSATAQTEKLVIKTQIYCSHCNECGSCGKRIETKLSEAITGFESVKIDTEKMTITVTYDSKKTTPAAIRKAIAGAGFDADEVKADGHAYAALDGCCKKK
ncbi:MAG: heavy-metal-associated domain-containing protein [Chitinophagales bacterium]|nr:heavy-metal-associated domain-containing protein [Chitinophagales bacterium]